MKRLLNWLRGSKPQEPTSGPVLRNKPGGMAWIKPYGHEFGAQVLAGRAVRTVAVRSGRLWTIDPPQQYIVGPVGVYYAANGNTLDAGETANIVAISDECLEPWREIGDDDRDESARWLPPVPAGLPTIADTRIRSGGEGA